MIRWTIILIIFILGAILTAWWLPLPYYSSPKAPNIETRAAIDIGSGSTNLKVAKVDTNTGKIIKILFDKSIPVPYQKHLEKSATNTFDDEVMGLGIKAIKELKREADNYPIKKVVAVATAAFRKADNGRLFANEIEKQTGIQVRIIDQDEEGILAFRGAISETPLKPQDAIVWDIGGGSMQLTTLTPAGTYFIDKGQMASIPFKNAVIEKVKNASIHDIHSPNPLSREELEKGLTIAEEASQSTNSFVKDKILDPQTQVLAVGNLFNYGVKLLVNNQIKITQSELEKAVFNLAGKSDDELTKFNIHEVAVTNPLLVLGYMEGLKINNIEIIQINNADGALTYPPYWE